MTKSCSASVTPLSTESTIWRAATSSVFRPTTLRYSISWTSRSWPGARRGYSRHCGTTSSMLSTSLAPACTSRVHSAGLITMELQSLGPPQAAERIDRRPHGQHPPPSPAPLPASLALPPRQRRHPHRQLANAACTASSINTISAVRVLARHQRILRTTPSLRNPGRRADGRPALGIQIMALLR